MGQANQIHTASPINVVLESIHEHTDLKQASPHNEEASDGIKTATMLTGLEPRQPTKAAVQLL